MGRLVECSYEGCPLVNQVCVFAWHLEGRVCHFHRRSVADDKARSSNCMFPYVGRLNAFSSCNHFETMEFSGWNGIHRINFAGLVTQAERR